MKKLGNKGSIGPVEIGLGAVLIIFIAFVIWRVSSADESVNQAAENNALVSNQAPITTQPRQGVEAITANSQEITLESVGDYTATGIATRAYDDADFTHELIIQTGNPAEGKFYEGWLVGDSVVSTGKLTQEGDGEWSLSFNSTEDLSGHLKVVVTEENEANGLDGKPEAHVLEGSFVGN